jgi:hypothetical protein
MESLEMLGKIEAFESGEMDRDEYAAFFQELIDNGLAWKLQGCYGRMASSLIKEGLCNPPKGGEK